MPTMCGEDPAFWGSHAVGCPDRGIVNIIVYHQLAAQIKAKVNIHQRAQWYLQTDQVKALLEGAEFVQFNAHCLNIGDTVGYCDKSFIPGFMLVGDAGGFGQPVEDFGANVAQVMGKIAAETAAEMKAKKDYSEAMFAKYEEKWRETWIPDDNVPEMNFLMQRGGFQKIVGVMDEAMNTMFKMRFNNHSFPEIALNIIPKVASDTCNCRCSRADRPERAQSFRDRSGVDAGADRARGGGQRVAHVVHAGHRQVDVDQSERRRHRDARAVRAQRVRRRDDRVGLGREVDDAPGPGDLPPDRRAGVVGREHGHAVIGQRQRGDDFAVLVRRRFD